MPMPCKTMEGAVCESARAMLGRVNLLFVRVSGDYGISAGFARSLRLAVARPDHLAPLLDFLGNEPAEIRGRVRKCSAAQVGKPRFHVGIGEARVDVLVELIDDLGRRVPRHPNAIHHARLVTRHKLTYGRKVR